MPTKNATVFVGREMEVDRHELLSQQESLVSSDRVPGEYCDGEAAIAFSLTKEETPLSSTAGTSEHGPARTKTELKAKKTRITRAAVALTPIRRSGRTAKPRTAPQIQPTPMVPCARRAKRSKGKVAVASHVAAQSGGREWEVEAIVNSRIDADTYEHFYEVKWKGFPTKDNTWEPKAQLTNCLEAVQRYEKKRAGAKR